MRKKGDKFNGCSSEKQRKPHPGIKNLVPFPKGKSGNPHGRPPRSSKTFGDIALRMFNLRVVEVDWARREAQRLKLAYDDDTIVAQVIAQATIIHAMRGSLGHLVELLNRTEGRTPMRVDGRVEVTEEDRLRVFRNLGIEIIVDNVESLKSSQPVQNGSHTNGVGLLTAADSASH